MNRPLVSRLKRPLRPLVACLLANPTLSNARVAAICRCDPRRIGRYRKAIRDNGYTHAELVACDELTLQALLKRDPGKRIEAQPDFDALGAELPNANAMAQWRHYCRSARADGHQPLSYSGFTRRLRARLAHARLAQSHSSWAVRRRVVERHVVAPRRDHSGSMQRLMDDVRSYVHAKTAAVLLGAAESPFDCIGTPHA